MAGRGAVGAAATGAQQMAYILHPPAMSMSLSLSSLLLYVLSTRNVPVIIIVFGGNERGKERKGKVQQLRHFVGLSVSCLSRVVVRQRYNKLINYTLEPLERPTGGVYTVHHN